MPRREPSSQPRLVHVSGSASTAPILRESEPAHELPLWRELFTVYDWMLLRSSLVWFGVGVPRGDGSAVITIPGFLGTDLYLTEFNLWLRRIGYASYRSAIGRNADCLNSLQRLLFRTLEQAHRDTGRPVHLIGHSLGGVIARSTAAHRPDLVASVTTLGAPFRGIRSHPLVVRTRDVVRKVIFGRPSAQLVPSECFTGHCTCDFVQALHHFPTGVRAQAIFTKADGVVDWRMCVTGDACKDREVLGTHIGLAFNPFVYKLVAEFLARQPPLPSGIGSTDRGLQVAPWGNTSGCASDTQNAVRRPRRARQTHR